MTRKLVAVLCLSVAATGCATFKANQLPVVPPADLASAPETKVKVFSRWTYDAGKATVSENVKVAAAAIQKKQFDEAVTASGCCVLVEGPSDADLVIDGKAFNDNNPAALIPAFITGLSLYAIPSWVTARVHLEATATRGEATRTFKAEDSATMVQWLPMIFAMPVKGNAIKAAQEVETNAHKTLLLGMKKEGLLP